MGINYRQEVNYKITKGSVKVLREIRNHLKGNKLTAAVGNSLTFVLSYLLLSLPPHTQ